MNGYEKTRGFKTDMTTALFIGSKDNDFLNFFYEAFTVWSRDRFPAASQPFIIEGWEDQDSINSALNSSEPDVFISFVPVSSTGLCCSHLRRNNKTLFFAPPLETSAQAKRDLIKRCKKDRLSVGTLWPCRFSPGLAKVKEITESLVLGELTEIKVTLSDIDNLLLSGRDNDVFSGRQAGFKPQTLIHLLDCAHCLLPSETAQRLTDVSITQQTESEINFNWKREDADPISLQISRDNPDGSAMSAEVMGEYGHVFYEGHDHINTGGRGNVIRQFSDNLNQRRNPAPITTPKEQLLTNCFNLMQISMHDKICFDCFFRPAADIVYESLSRINRQQ